MKTPREGNAQRSSSGGTLGVVVVHGVGDPQPGETLDDLTDLLSTGPERLVDLDPRREVHRLLDRNDARSSVLEFFPRGLNRPAVPGMTIVELWR